MEVGTALSQVCFHHASLTKKSKGQASADQSHFQVSFFPPSQSDEGRAVLRQVSCKELGASAVRAVFAGSVLVHAPPDSVQEDQDWRD